MALQYSLVLLCALILATLLTPIARVLAIRCDCLDYPSSPVKTHMEPVPHLGGLAITISFFAALALLRFLTHFPTGTLHALRGILAGAVVLLIIGLADDIAPSRLHYIHYVWKFLFQILAAATLVILFDVRIKFIHPIWLSYIVSILWVVGITNAFNIIDIMDGLSASQAVIASLAFLFISLPTEEIYVNFAAAACAGACMGFLPYNLSKRRKIFMGDAGSLSIGFFMAALSMGTPYTRINEIGLFAPILILGLPLYDTVLVSILRIWQGQSPFLGSKDHLALKLEAMGLKRKQIVVACGGISLTLSLLAYIVTRVTLSYALGFYGLIILLGAIGIFKLRKVRVT